MQHRSFAEYVARRDEGLWLPMRPIVASMGKINPFPTTTAHLNRIRAKPVKPMPPAGGTLPKVIPSPISQHLKSIQRVFG